MSEEKEQRKVEEAKSDHATVESGNVIGERKLLRKLDLDVLPCLTLLLLSFLDQSNGNATDLHMSASLSLSIVNTILIPV